MPPRLDQARRARARELRLAGYSRSQIAPALGVKTGGQALDRWLRGVPPPEWTKRPNAKDELRGKAVSLRREGKSYRDIQKELGVSMSSLSLWLRDVPLTERHQAALRERRITAARLRATAIREGTILRDAAIVEKASAEITGLDPQQLFIAGVVGYWAEGAKNKPWRRGERVSFSNSDPGLVKIFLAWLELLGVEPERIFFRIQIHEKADLEAAHRYWAEVLRIDRRTLLPPTLKRHNPRTVRKNVGDGYYGCLRIDVRRSAELNRRIEGWFRGILGLLAENSADSRDSSVGPGRSLPHTWKRSGVV